MTRHTTRPAATCFTTAHAQATVQRPILLTAPTRLHWNPRPDLADRTLAVTLPPIPPQRRLPEADLWRQFDAARPSLLGALCTALSTALHRLESVHLPAPPRFADAATWAVAASELLALSHPPDPTLWPRNPSAFSRHLKDLIPSLSARDLELQFHRAHGGRRLITLEPCEAP